MASFSYATTGSGPSAGGIGWINWGTFSLTPGQTINNISAAFRDGSTVTFNISNTVTSGSGLTFTATSAPVAFNLAPFGRTGYTGISGNVILYSGGNTTAASSLITISNIVVRNSVGRQLNNYYLIYADGESTGGGESQSMITNGTNWTLLAMLPPPAGNPPLGPSVSGLNTNTVIFGTVANTGQFQGPVIITQNPTQITSNLSSPTGGFLEGAVIGFALDKISIRKIILPARLSATDQFELSISGTPSSTTITSGTAAGIQDQYAEIVGFTGNSYVLDETIALGSLNASSQYRTTVISRNLTPGGTTVPATLTLPHTITIALGDIIVTTVSNVAITGVTSSKSVSASFADVNQVLTYTIPITNTGPTTIDDVILVDTIPAGSTFVPNSLFINNVNNSLSPAPPGISIGQIPPQATTTVVFKVRVNDSVPTPNRVVNVASAAAITSGAPVSIVDFTTTNTTSTTIAAAILTAVKAVDKPFASVGDRLIYTMTLSNSGNVTATQIRFIDTIPSGTTFTANSLQQDQLSISGSSNPPGVTLPNAIPPGSISTITFQVTVETIPALRSIVNDSSWLYSYTFDPSVVNGATKSVSSNRVLTEIRDAQMNITKSVNRSHAAVGDILTYTLTIPNTGNVTANNIVIRDTIPTGTTFIPGSVFINSVESSANISGPGTLQISSIPAGSITTVTFQVRVNTSIPATNPIPNQSSLGYNFILNPNTNEATARGGINSNIVLTTIISPIIINSKSVDLASGYVGDPLTYTMAFRNIGNTTAANVKFIDTMPNATSFIPNTVSINGVNQPGMSVEPPNGITLPDVAQNQAVTITFQALVETIPNPNPTTNQGILSFDYVSDPNQAARSGVSSTNIVSTFIYPITNPFKAVDKQFATVGDVITYTIGWDERDNVDDNQVRMIDTIPNGLSFIPNSVNVNGIPRAGATVTPPDGIFIGTIAAFQSVTVTYQAIVNTVPSINPIPNDYTILFTNTLVEGLQSEVSNEVFTQINLQTITPVRKQVDKSFSTMGDVLTYSLVLNNTGNTTISSLVLVDTIPNGASFVLNSIQVNGVTRTGSLVNPPNGLNVGTVPAGLSTITFQVHVTSIPANREITNIGTFSYQYIVDPIVETTRGGIENTNTVTTTLNYADIRFPIKEVNKKFSNLPATLSYTITIVNTGITTATNLVFSDTIPDDTVFVTNSLKINSVSLSANPNPPGVSLPNLAPGAITTITFDVFVDTVPATNPIPNAGTLRYDFLVDPTNGQLFSASGNTNIVNTQINHVNLGDFKKFVDKSFASCADILNYLLVLTNTGNVAAQDVVITDTIPNGTAFVANSIFVNGSPKGGVPTNITIPSIQAGETVTINYQVKIIC